MLRWVVTRSISIECDALFLLILQIDRLVIPPMHNVWCVHSKRIILNCRIAMVNMKNAKMNETPIEP